MSRDYVKIFYRKNRFSFFLAVLATFCNTLLGFGITWILQEMLDAAVGVPGAMSIPGLILGTLGVLLSLLACKVVLYLSKPRFLRKAMSQFKALVFGRLMDRSDLGTGTDYTSLFSNDMTAIETNYLEARFLLIRNAIEMTGALAMMLWYNPLMTAVAMGFLVLPTAAAAFQGSRLEEAELTVSKENAGLLSTLRDCLGGFSVIKSFSAEKRMEELMEGRIGTAEEAKCRRRRITTVLDSIGSLSALAAQLGTFLTGTFLILSGHAMTPGVLVAFMDLTATFIDPVSELPGLIGNRRASLALIRSMAEALADHRPAATLEAPETLTEGITLTSLTCGYGQEEPVLKGLDFTFRPGRCYAVVGASGSGKSTLLNLLQGKNSYSGSVTLDGLELRDIHSLCGLVSVIQQNVFLFNASILDNITLFADFPEEEIRRAAELSGLAGLMAEKGPGYLCGENGCNLSGGEKQRISIARALLKHSRVLLADEATAALDPRTAAQVSGAILDLAHMTRIVVTHALEPGLLKRYDCILAMKNGQIREYGSFEDLMDRKGYFYSLYTLSQ